MHTLTVTTVMMTKINPVMAEIIAIIKTVWSWIGSMMTGVGTVVGVSIWHSDWASAGTNRSHSKSTAYGALFKKRTGSDRYQSLSAVYSCCVWKASLVLMLPENTIAPSTSLLQNEWVMVMEEREMLGQIMLETEIVYVRMCCSSSFN